MARKKQCNTIPVALSKKEFNEFILPHLKKGSRGPEKKISFYKLFNYILKLMHTGCQWKNVPIEKDDSGNPEIHYTSIFKMFRFWVKEGCFEKIFESTVLKLFEEKMLDTSVMHGDGTSTVAKKGEII
jgi:hypothetical protein